MWKSACVGVYQLLNNTHIYNQCFFFRKSCRLLDNVEKYGKAWRAADNNMAHAYCVLDN